MKAPRFPLRPPLPLVLCLGFGLGMLVINDIVQLSEVAEHSGDLLANVFARIQSITALVFVFLITGVGIEIRRRGCVTFFKFERWEEIALRQRLLEQP